MLAARPAACTATTYGGPGLDGSPALFLRQRDRSESSRLRFDACLGRETLDAGGAEEAVDTRRPREHMLDVRGLGNRTAVAQDQDVLAHAAGCVMHLVDSLSGFIQRKRGLCANRPLR